MSAVIRGAFLLSESDKRRSERVKLSGLLAGVVGAGLLAIVGSAHAAATIAPIHRAAVSGGESVLALSDTGTPSAPVYHRRRHHRRRHPRN